MPARHDLILVPPEGWGPVAASRPPLSAEAVALVERWGAAGWPVIARRPAPGDAPGAVPVGLPLPPALPEGRVALGIPGGVAWRPSPPVALAEASAAAPAPWGGTVDGLLVLARRLGLVPRVFGALLWQSLTGLPYLRTASDLDLLWPVADAGLLPSLLDGIAALDAAAPMRIDGEVLTPRGGVNWRELRAAGPGGIVLVKSMDRVGFAAASDLFAPEGPPCR